MLSLSDLVLRVHLEKGAVLALCAACGEPIWVGQQPPIDAIYDHYCLPGSEIKLCMGLKNGLVSFTMTKDNLPFLPVEA